MNANKPVLNSFKFVIIVLCSNILSAAATWVICEDNAPDHCKPPTGGMKDCIAIRSCEWMMAIIQQPQPLNEDTKNLLKSFRCEDEGKTIKVRCPNITLPQSKPVIVTTKQPLVEVILDISNHQNLNLLSQDCGVANTDNRIYGGNKTFPFEFPWMALLSYKIENVIKFQCGGTIINDRYILTAAHCITNLGNRKLYGIRLGEHNIDTREDCVQIDPNVRICAPPVQDIAVEEVIPHPEYDENIFTNDIGLVRLAWPINITVENVKPICLPVTEELRNINFLVHNFTVTGWGVTDRTHQSSPELLRADIPTVSETNCRKAYEKTDAVIDSNHICAGSKTSDSCAGDSGGPLQKVDFYNMEARHVQYGVVSFGPKFCGNTRAPGVYTRVDRYLNWILDNLKS